MKILFTLLFLTASVFAQTSVPNLSENEIIQLVGFPYPEGSAEEEAEFKVLLHHQKTRSEEDCKDAHAQEKPSLKVFFGGTTGPLTEQEVVELEEQLAGPRLYYSANNRVAKNIFKRQRPYLKNPEITPCTGHGNSFAYPSGHTTLARLWARILGRLFPERKELFLRSADRVAFNRVLGGVHHPSDIVAGKRLGDELARRYLLRFDL